MTDHKELLKHLKITKLIIIVTRKIIDNVYDRSQGTSQQYVRFVFRV